MEIIDREKGKISKAKLNKCGGAVYTDGSGGQNSDDAELRRCGWAATVIRKRNDTGEYVMFAAIGGNLPGRRQTVPRVEFTAVIQLLI